MSFETLNPEEYMKNPSQEQNPQEEQTQVNSTLEMLADAMPYLIELGDSIKDIPAQMDLNGRLNLAARFVVIQPSGVSFFKDQFEKCYMAVSSFDPEDWIMKQKAEASFVQTNAHKVE